MAKRGRDFSATLEQQLKVFKPVRVNPFPLMMDAAARQYQAQQASSAYAAACHHNNSSTTKPVATCTTCSHCGCGLSDLQVQQCHACKAIYCSSCSVINYDEREDRVFCLDCNTDCMQLTSCEEAEVACGGSNDPFSTYQQPFCSPPGPDMNHSSINHCGSGVDLTSQAMSLEQRSSIMRACNMAAAAAAAAADSGSSCAAAMAGISGSPLFAQGGVGLCGFGGNSSAGRGRGGAGLPIGQWDLNSPPLASLAMVLHDQVLAPPAALPFTAGY